MTDPRPLVPVNLEGLEALANELLLPATTDSGILEDATPLSLKNPSSYIFLPA